MVDTTKITELLHEIFGVLVKIQEDIHAMRVAEERLDSLEKEMAMLEKKLAQSTN